MATNSNNVDHVTEAAAGSSSRSCVGTPEFRNGGGGGTSTPVNGTTTVSVNGRHEDPGSGLTGLTRLTVRVGEQDSEETSSDKETSVEEDLVIKDHDDDHDEKVARLAKQNAERKKQIILRSAAAAANNDRQQRHSTR